ncbi:hypothetical protein NEAUS03_2235 [Nematocida ausubeli]|nr:hypothetical protein NEAUS03_2235 [Nematocida ausubeli]
MERKRIRVIECTLEILKTVHAKDKLLCLAKKKNVVCLKEAAEETKQLEKIVKLYRERVQCVRGIGIINSMCRTQKGVISGSVGVYNAYRA